MVRRQCSAVCSTQPRHHHHTQATASEQAGRPALTHRRHSCQTGRMLRRAPAPVSQPASRAARTCVSACPRMACRTHASGRAPATGGAVHHRETYLPCTRQFSPRSVPPPLPFCCWALGVCCCLCCLRVGVLTGHSGSGRRDWAAELQRRQKAQVVLQLCRWVLARRCTGGSGVPRAPQL